MFFSFIFSEPAGPELYVIPHMNNLELMPSEAFISKYYEKAITALA